MCCIECWMLQQIRFLWKVNVAMINVANKTLLFKICKTIAKKLVLHAKQNKNFIYKNRIIKWEYFLELCYIDPLNTLCLIVWTFLVSKLLVDIHTINNNYICLVLLPIQLENIMYYIIVVAWLIQMIALG